MTTKRTRNGVPHTPEPRTDRFGWSDEAAASLVIERALEPSSGDLTIDANGDLVAVEDPDPLRVRGTSALPLPPEETP